MPDSARSLAPLVLLSLAALAPRASADLAHDWLARLPAGSTLGSGLQAMVTDASGVTYVTGNAGTSNNNDVVTAAIGPDGGTLWTRVFDGPAQWHDQARGIALGPNGRVWVTGNTPGPNHFANVLLLQYDAASGTLLTTVQYSSGPGLSEHGASVAVDSSGDVYVAGGTVGDGPDVMLIKFDLVGGFVWKRTWDGPAFAPYSLDSAREVLLDPAENPVVLIHGVMSSLHPDYVVAKYSATDGAPLWIASWGVSGEDSPADMELDELGDVYVTGTGIDLQDKYSTVKLRGSDGQLLWQAYDFAGLDDFGAALALDGLGGVYVTGGVDPDGDFSNFNHDVYTVKRDATTGAQLWTHRYGAPCVGCHDVPGDVQVDGSGRVFVAGRTSSPPYSADQITLVLDADSGLELERGILSGSPTESAEAAFLRFDAAFRVYEGGRFYDANTGAVAISVLRYTLTDPTWSNYCVGAPNSLGAGAGIGATGNASIAANTFTLTASGAAASQFGLFYYGPDQVLQPFGDGFRCVGGATFRLQPALLTSPSGAAARQLDFTAPPASSGPGAILPGSRWNVQFWYRDPAFGGATFNLSDALSVDFVP